MNAENANDNMKEINKDHDATKHSEVPQNEMKAVESQIKVFAVVTDLKSADDSSDCTHKTEGETETVKTDSLPCTETNAIDMTKTDNENLDNEDSCSKNEKNKTKEEPLLIEENTAKTVPDLISSETENTKTGIYIFLT